MTTTRRPAQLRVLLETQFGLYCAGNGVSLVGTWMQRTGCSWLVWEWTHSVFWLGLLSAGDLLPSMLIGPFAGVAADRWDRLRQNMRAQLASVLLAALTALLLSVHQLGIVGLVLLITVQGTLTAVIQPARLAMVQQMVAREDMGAAVALNSVVVNLTRMVGPALAGVMIVHFDVLWVFVANAVVTTLFVLVLARLRLMPASVRREDSPGFIAELVEGFVYIARTGPLWMILLVMLCGGSLVRAMIELIPAIAAGTFKENATGLAMLTGAAAFGAVASGLTMSVSRAARILHSVLLWWCLGALAAIALTQVHSATLAVAAAIVIGTAITRGLVSTQTFVQLTTPDALRGRVLSVHGLIARGSPALGALLIGFVADRIGLARAVELSSGLMLVLLLALLPRARRLARQLEDEGA